jgi:hypothetical protein
MREVAEFKYWHKGRGEYGYKYVGGEKFKKPKVHTVFTVECNG